MGFKEKELDHDLGLIPRELATLPQQAFQPFEFPVWGNQL